ncbi:MAG: energy-coupling factor transporter transmembrane protein EcfT [Clostridiales bacterium]|nr:energy-coupling factor transporter transmembrane protein EcfT [Clostridiales bacterium]
MLSDISLGRYYKADSILHRTDPRVKTLLYLVYLVVIFIVRSPLALCALGVVTVIQICMAKVSLPVVWKTVSPVLPLSLFILLLNLLTIRQGNTIFQWQFISITDYGLGRAVLMAIRLIFLILSTSLMLTLTTTPLKIADALESLFSPLKLIKVPVHEMAMMMSIALRFIPTLIEETDKIMKAQVSRGADYDTGSFINRLKGYITVLIPLFVSSFRRAEELAVAMDARCYRGGAGRTKLNPLRLNSTDVIVGLFLTVCAAGLVVMDLTLR